MPELVVLARRLGIRFPGRLRIIAIAVRDPHTIGGEMSPPVLAALPALCDRRCGR